MPGIFVKWLMNADQADKKEKTQTLCPFRVHDTCKITSGFIKYMLILDFNLYYIYDLFFLMELNCCHKDICKCLQKTNGQIPFD